MTTDPSGIDAIFWYDDSPELNVWDCECALVDHPEIGPHTEMKHKMDSCGRSTGTGACGGCMDCLLAQHAYYDQLEREAAKLGERADETMRLIYQEQQHQ